MKIFNIEIGRRKPRDEYTANRNGSLVSRWAHPPTRNTSEWLGMFSQSPRLAVVDRIANDLASISGKLLQVGEDGAETEVSNHSFLDFMRKPNPLYEMTSSAVWRLHEIYLLLVGESFLLIERDDRGRPVELWNVPPHWVRATPYRGSPSYSVVSPGGVTMTVPVDDMFVMKLLNPLDPFLRGLGIAESVADEIEIDEYAAKFQKRFFYNDATPPIVFLMPDATSEQRDAFLARWNQKHRGVGNSHRAAAFSGNVDVKELGGGSGKELGFVESRLALRNAVLEHFGVPREIMGITENSNRATADAAQYIYAKNVLAPKIKMREEAINTQLLPLFGRNLIWRFDPVIPYDKDFNKAKAIDAYSAGLITKNEARRLLDMPDVEGGDEYRASIDAPYAVGSHDFAGEIRRNYPGRAAGPAGAMSKSKTRVELPAVHVQDEIEAVAKSETMFAAALVEYFQRQRAAVDAALSPGGEAFDEEKLRPLLKYFTPMGELLSEQWDRLSEQEQDGLAELAATAALDWKAENEELLGLLGPLWKETYAAGATTCKARYSWGQAECAELSGPEEVEGPTRVEEIAQSTKGQIAAAVAKGLQEHADLASLGAMVSSELAGSAGARVWRIAKHEALTAFATGEFSMARAAGATTKTWHHTPQEHPRDGSHGPNHVIMDGETVPIDSKFSNGLRFPRDPRDPRPEELINCRCYATYSGFF